jgi:hypothetical protein
VTGVGPIQKPPRASWVAFLEGGIPDVPHLILRIEPAEDLERFGVNAADLRDGRSTAAFAELMRFEAGRARVLRRIEAAHRDGGPGEPFCVACIDCDLLASAGTHRGVWL